MPLDPAPDLLEATLPEPPPLTIAPAALPPTSVSPTPGTDGFQDRDHGQSVQLDRDALPVVPPVARAGEPNARVQGQPVAARTADGRRLDREPTRLAK